MRVNVCLPNSPRGTEVEVPGLGIFKNGDVVDVDDDAVEQAVLKGQLPESVLDGDELICGDPEAELAPPIPDPVEEDEEPDSDLEADEVEGGGF